MGFGFSQDGIAAVYATPLVVFPFWGSLYGRSSESTTQVAVIIGEIIGHFLNDAIMRITTRRNGGVFEAESRLWWVQTTYLLGCGH
jgi:hypothetical protein